MQHQGCCLHGSAETSSSGHLPCATTPSPEQLHKIFVHPQEQLSAPRGFLSWGSQFQQTQMGWDRHSPKQQPHSWHPTPCSPSTQVDAKGFFKQI